jgi:hypothetical protein
MTNALNVVADALAPQPGVTLLAPVEEAPADARTAAVFAEIRTFYERQDVPVPFRLMAHDAGYLAEVWQAVQRAFSEQHLTRRLKEALAFAVSVTSRSAFGTAFHLAEMRRLGVSAGGVMEVLGVTQMFSSYTKIADTLQLEPDMAGIAPVDWSPAPGGKTPATSSTTAE